MGQTAIASRGYKGIGWWVTQSTKLSAFSISFTVAMNIAYAPAGLTPEIVLPPITGSQSTPSHSLDALYELRDRLTTTVTGEASGAVFVISNGDSKPSTLNRYQRHVLDVRIQIEETAQYHWESSQKLARRAVRLGKNKPLTATHLEQSSKFWQAAISQLEQIPVDSLLAPAAADKINYYQVQLAEIAYRYDTVRSTFLLPIAASTGLDVEQVHITVCNLEIDECRHLNGDRPPTSPASLIKVPLAVALMQKISDEHIDLTTPIYIDPHNYTEDASDIWIGVDYPLQDVVASMINQSSNIATNQLIDYLEFDYINAVFQDRGYEEIYVGSKLIGDQIEPEQFGSEGRNRITTDELTVMMIEIYREMHPGDDVLMDMLSTQTDDRMGQSALHGDDLVWLGEKTGWNSEVLGSTTAATIQGDRYVMTVALDYTANTNAMRKIIRCIAKHILDNNGF